MKEIQKSILGALERLEDTASIAEIAEASYKAGHDSAIRMVEDNLARAIARATDIAELMPEEAETMAQAVQDIKDVFAIAFDLKSEDEVENRMNLALCRVCPQASECAGADPGGCRH